MPRTLSPAAIASLTAESTAEVWVVLLTIDHPTLAQPIRVANDNAACVSNGATYIACPFAITLPGEDAEEPGVAMVEIPNVDREIVAAGRSIVGPATCSIQVVLAASPNTVEVKFEGMSLREMDWDAATVRGKMRFETIVTEPVTYIITPERFPGLF